jgi:transcriptional regulator with XRE-family HTH domain
MSSRPHDDSQAEPTADEPSVSPAEPFAGASAQPSADSPAADTAEPGTDVSPATQSEQAAEPGAALSPSQQIAAALKRERLRAGLSLSEVARRAGVGKSTMSGLETGSGNPSLETMWALAAALDIPLARLLDPPPQEVALQRVGDLPSLPSTTANYVATLLSPSPTNARRDIYFIQAEPGEPKRSQPHPQGTIEHVILGSGAARVEVLGKSYDLGVGDYLTYPGDQPHHFTALAPGTNVVFVVESS